MGWNKIYCHTSKRRKNNPISVFMYMVRCNSFLQRISWRFLPNFCLFFFWFLPIFSSGRTWKSCETNSAIQGMGCPQNFLESVWTFTWIEVTNQQLFSPEFVSLSCTISLFEKSCNISKIIFLQWILVGRTSYESQEGLENCRRLLLLWWSEESKDWTLSSVIWNCGTMFGHGDCQTGRKSIRIIFRCRNPTIW